ncbi:hypothetical protein THARTR1_04687 [Trichoderma harzianum]|uniref:Uncharacterized protein n=1 Tax=Trichoderma harzianum TaxID=5544 RepID=A0A2K0UB32_TRIHA|nr:hypothetical protein THARTR1_04687 [Trichoderma harzianum]
MGFWRPIAKLEVKFETWRWRNRGYTLLERSEAEPEPKEWWELVMERKKKARKAERRAAKEERRAAKEEQRAAKEARRAAKEQRRRERQSREFDWRDYIPRFPKVVGYTPLWKIDEMLASGNGVRW